MLEKLKLRVYDVLVETEDGELVDRVVAVILMGKRPADLSRFWESVFSLFRREFWLRALPTKSKEGAKKRKSARPVRIAAMFPR